MDGGRFRAADDLQRDLLMVLRSAPELLQGRAVFYPTVAEEEALPLVRPDAAAHPHEPAHAVPGSAVRLQEHAVPDPGP
jgi:hypothetical protein